MEALTQIITAINDIVWGPPMLVAILGTGLYLQLRLRFMPITRILSGFVMVWRGRKAAPGAPGEITPYAALMTALAATVGTGNIAGVATAIALGGPGAMFWMWMTALVGMATKYSEVLLAVHYRETDDHGEQVGAPCTPSRTAWAKAGAGWARPLRSLVGWPASGSATWSSPTASLVRLRRLSASTPGFPAW